MPETAKQVKSKQRVADHGEVFTAEREVNAMLDLVKVETENIESTFLEPACGDGNFLAEILRRKLAAVDKENYSGKRCLTDSWQPESVHAVSTLYGIDLLHDNVEECRNRLYAIWDEAYTKACKKNCTDECRETVRFILHRNIICGNALDLCCVNEQGDPLYQTNESGHYITDLSGKPIKIPIIFSQWAWDKFNTRHTVKRTDYRLDVLLREHADASAYEKYPREGVSQTSFLPEIGDYHGDWDVDRETGIIIPRPVDDSFEKTEYLNLPKEIRLKESETNNGT